MSPEDEAAISEINILPDGRVCVFGASQQVLELLDAIPLDDAGLQDRIGCLRAGSTVARERGTEEVVEKGPTRWETASRQLPPSPLACESAPSVGTMKNQVRQ
jgi:hypothetical protein